MSPLASDPTMPVTCEHPMLELGQAEDAVDVEEVGEKVSCLRQHLPAAMARGTPGEGGEGHSGPETPHHRGSHG